MFSLSLLVLARHLLIRAVYCQPSIYYHLLVVQAIFGAVYQDVLGDVLGDVLSLLSPLCGEVCIFINHTDVLFGQGWFIGMFCFVVVVESRPTSIRFIGTIHTLPLLLPLLIITIIVLQR